MIFLDIGRSLQPGGDAHVHALLEGGTESAVAVVAAFLRQLLGDNGLLGSGKLAVAGYEVSDTKVVDVFIVAGVLTGEILAEIVAVHTHGYRELRQGQVRLQVELCFLAVLRQQLADIGSHALGGGVLCFTRHHSRVLAWASFAGELAGRGMAVDAQVFQCLHAPQQETRQRESGKVGDGGHHVVVGIFIAHEQ